MSCGYGNLFKHTDMTLNAMPSIKFEQVWLYSAYLGRVKITVGKTPNPNQVKMECKGVGSASDIIVREVDAVKAKIDINTNPSLRQLVSKPAAVVDIEKNKENFYLIQQMELQKAIRNKDTKGIILRQTALDRFNLIEEDNSVNRISRKFQSVQFDADSLRKLYAENSVVDIHFNTTLYLQFLQEKLNRPSINNGKLLISIYNIADMDNAYFTGEYMAYGNGQTYFYPLTAIDVCGHELGHGLIQDTAGLEYQAESGALNESFADVLGSAFEFWLYDKFNNDVDPNNDIQGGSDWLVGEDIGQQIKYLRNLKDPTASQDPQPKKYRGQYWVNTSDISQNNDYGGVHTNSGVGNHCFYLLSQLVGIDTSLPIFYNCLLKLNRNSSYTEFSDNLYKCTPEHLRSQTIKCLTSVNLSVNNTHTPDSSPTNHTPPLSFPYPNSHIPFIQGLCCPHCLCIQNSESGSTDRERKRRRIVND